MPLGISYRYLLFFFQKYEIKKKIGVCQQYRQCVRMSRTIGRGVEIRTVKMWKQHRSIHNYIK